MERLAGEWAQRWRNVRNACASSEPARWRINSPHLPPLVREGRCNKHMRGFAHHHVEYACLEDAEGRVQTIGAESGETGLVQRAYFRPELLGTGADCKATGKACQLASRRARYLRSCSQQLQGNTLCHILHPCDRSR